MFRASNALFVEIKRRLPAPVLHKDLDKRNISYPLNIVFTTDCIGGILE